MLISKLEKNRPFIISGPCSAESEQQVLRTANAIKSIVDVFRAGLWKPRTKPNNFEGVGEKGLKLSGGQIQRVAIARCLYKNSKILIFDESTNALDLETEDKILETIESLKGQKTIFMISHKINSLRYCNKILKIEDNNILEQSN